jgi:hypothetical protein
MGIEFERKKKTKEDEIVKKKNLKNDPKQNNY